MSSIPIDRLKPGMTVVSKIVNMDGHLLMPEGTELTENRIETLLAWGITEVDIDDNREEISEDDAALEANIESQKAALKHNFKFCETTDPAVDELMRVCAERLARKQSQHT